MENCHLISYSLSCIYIYIYMHTVMLFLVFLSNNIFQQMQLTQSWNLNWHYHSESWLLDSVWIHVQDVSFFGGVMDLTSLQRMQSAYLKHHGQVIEKKDIIICMQRDKSIDLISGVKFVLVFSFSSPLVIQFLFPSLNPWTVSITWNANASFQYM